VGRVAHAATRGCDLDAHYHCRSGDWAEPLGYGLGRVDGEPVRWAPLLLILAACTTTPTRRPLGAAAISNASTIVDPVTGNAASVVDAGTGYALKVSGISAATGAPAPGTPAYNPSWYAATSGTVTYVCWDPATGSDSALPGTAASCGGCSVGSTSVATFGEIVRRYGSSSPTLTYGNSVVVCKLSAQSAGVDPVFFFPRLSGGGYAALVDTLVQFAAPQAAGTVTQIVKTSGSASDMTIASMPAGTTAGMYVFDSTAGGYAFVESMSSSTATMSQPLNTSLVTTIGLPTAALGTAWSTGDTITVYNVPNLSNLKAWQPKGGDVVGSAASVGWVQWTQIADSSGASNASYYPLINEATSNVLSGVYIAPRVHIGISGGRGQQAWLLGCFAHNPVAIFSGEPEIYASYLASTLTNQGTDSLVDGNTTVNGTTSVTALLQSVTAHYNGLITLAGAGGQFEITSGGVAWGAAGVSISPQGSFWSNPSWSTSLLLSGSLTFGSNTTGCNWSGATPTCSINLTAANLVTNGSLQDLNSGARFTLTQ
jgi:hypothetical protein